jgi:signal transduction histidine kinase
MIRAMIARHAGSPLAAGTGIRASALLAWSLLVLAALLILTSIILDLLTPDFLAPLAQKRDPLLTVASTLLPLACSTIGAWIASRLRGNPVGWIFCGMGLLYAVRRFTIAYADYALLVRPSVPAGELTAWTSTWLRFSGPILLGVLLVLLFPGGCLPSRRWRLVTLSAVAGAAMLAVGDAFRFGPLVTYYHVYNPFGVAGTEGNELGARQLVEASSVGGGALLCAAILAALGALVLRMRRATGDERRQLKWFSYAALPALVGSCVMLLGWTAERFAILFVGATNWPLLWAARRSGLFANDSQAADRLKDLRLDTILESLSALAFLAIPVFVAIAILQHRLYEQELGAAGGVRQSLVPLWALGWPRILLAGVGAGVFPFALYLLVYAYSVFYPAVKRGESSSEQLAQTAAYMGGSLAQGLFLATTILAAWWVAQRTRATVSLHGTLVGLVAAIVNQLTIYYSYTSETAYFYQPVTLAGLSVYVTFGITGGWLGGSLASAPLAGEVYAATRRIGAAEDADEIAAAIGTHLGGSEARDVTLWRATSWGNRAENSPDEYERWGLWTAHEEDGSSLESNLRDRPGLPGLAHLDARPSSLVRSTSLPASQRAAWERRGIRSALFVPLIAPGERRVALLAATFRKRRGPSRRVVRAYLTVGAQAALALENMRLVEEARRAGRATGLLDERQRLAGEIHDTLAQDFTGIITSLKAVQVSRTQDASGSTRYIEDAERMAREGLAEARRLVWALRPEALHRGSLSEALERLAEDWSVKTRVEAHVETTGAARPLLPETEVALLRTAQEALTNTRKHAGASTVNITLSYMDDRVSLDVVDDGAGFDPARLNDPALNHYTGGFGLVAMRERIAQLGGTLVVESAPGQGTAVAVELPISGDSRGLREPERER